MTCDVVFLSECVKLECDDNEEDPASLLRPKDGEDCEVEKSAEVDD